MVYRATLDYLYAQLPMYQRIGAAAYKKDLTNTLALCEYLGHPERQFASIHVGGTNGKGSVSHLLAAACQAAGLKTGLYVSPHYRDFRERIRVNGRYIPRQRVVDFVAQHRARIDEIQPSFFELCVALAFDHFARERVDVAIVEVGLGGRLDSTNVITPLLSVITNISYDHMALLGNTLPLIAGEKAGIIKPKVPVVIGETHPESAPVFVEKAAQMGAPIVFADQRFSVQEKSTTLGKSTYYEVRRDGQTFIPDLEVDAAGPFQTHNVATALAALEHLPQLPLSLETTRRGWANLRALTRFQGRWQVIGQHPTVLCDSAHNEAGLRAVFGHLKPLLEANPASQLHVVTGFVNDKDVDGVLGLFPTEAQYYFAKADIPRGLEAGILQEKAATHGLLGRKYTSVKGALQAARRAAGPDDLVLVVGSIFVVAEVLPQSGTFQISN
jgi:dihydrofolate synthase/folylpolyglutamate synthase